MSFFRVCRAEWAGTEAADRLPGFGLAGEASHLGLDCPEAGLTAGFQEAGCFFTQSLHLTMVWLHIKGFQKVRLILVPKFESHGQSFRELFEYSSCEKIDCFKEDIGC